MFYRFSIYETIGISCVSTETMRGRSTVLLSLPPLECILDLELLYLIINCLTVWIRVFSKTFTKVKGKGM